MEIITVQDLGMHIILHNFMSPMSLNHCIASRFGGKKHKLHSKRGEIKPTLYQPYHTATVCFTTLENNSYVYDILTAFSGANNIIKRDK